MKRVLFATNTRTGKLKLSGFFFFYFNIKKRFARGKKCHNKHLDDFITAC